MNMLKKVIVPSVIALTLSLPMTASAAIHLETAAITTQSDPLQIPATTTESDPLQIPATTTESDPLQSNNEGDQHHKFHKGKRGFGRHMLGSGVHQQTYLTLLVEKYAPESLPEWDAAFTERNKLKEQIKLVLDNNPNGLNKIKAQKKDKSDKQQEKWKQQKEVYQNFDAAVKSKDAAKIKLALSSMLSNFKQNNTHFAQKLELIRQGAK